MLTISLVGVFSVASLLTLASFEVVSIGISPLYSYRLTEEEAKTLDAAHRELHDRMAKGEYDLIADDLVEARVSKEENLRRIKETVGNFGAPTEFEFFRAAEPVPASKHYPEHHGTNHITYYFAKAEYSVFSESIDWIVDNSGRAKIRSYSADEILEWQKIHRERERRTARVLPNEIRMPFFGRFIEVRY